MFATLNNAVAVFRRWQERQRVLNELYAMDDRMLADIGLRRGDIPFVKLDKPTAPHAAQPARSVANETQPRAA
ncbi:MAG TPA: DUF1127 domain-containing protein [Aliidongia sp.]|nr:DUF1127 domain-containing protein [Aliidongia sp.]